MATAAGLAIVMRRFKRASLVVSEDIELLPVCFRAVRSAAEECIVGSDASLVALMERYGLQPGDVTVEEVEPYPVFPAGADPDCGLYRPGASRGLTVVQQPTTTLAQRARARALLSRARLSRRLAGH
jgi:hypothetical protein